MASTFEEKRHFPRIRLAVPVHYQVRGTPESNTVVVDNISVGGLSFVNSSFLAPSTRVRLQLNVLSRVLSPVGKIAWSLPLPHSDRYRHGIEFLEMEPAEKYYLSDYIDILLNKF